MFVYFYHADIQVFITKWRETSRLFGGKKMLFTWGPDICYRMGYIVSFFCMIYPILAFRLMVIFINNIIMILWSIINLFQDLPENQCGEWNFMT